MKAGSKQAGTSLEDQKLSAEIEKLRTENLVLRRSVWRTPAFVLAVLGLLVSLAGNVQQLISARRSSADSARQMELAEARWRTEREKLIAETSLTEAQSEQLDVSLAKEAPSFSVTYVSLSPDGYDQLARSEEEPGTYQGRKPYNLFPGLTLYHNSLHKQLMEQNLPVPDSPKIDIRNLQISCLVLRLEGSRPARNVWIDARKLTIPGVASLPQQQVSPTQLLLTTFANESQPLRIGLGDISPGNGFVIPLFAASTSWDTRLAFGSAVVPLRVNFVDLGRKKHNETSQEIRPMEPNPFMIQGGAQYSGGPS